jgi:hypothetical protein
MKASAKFAQRPLMSAVLNNRHLRHSSQSTPTELSRVIRPAKKITLAAAGMRNTQDVQRVSSKPDTHVRADVQSKPTERSGVKKTVVIEKSIETKPPKPSKNTRKAKGRRVATSKPSPPKPTSNKLTVNQANVPKQSHVNSQLTKSTKTIKSSKHKHVLAPVVDAPKIDKLAVAVQVRSALHESILWAARDLQHQATEALPKLELVQGKPGTRFRYKYIVRDTKGKHIGYIAFDPVQRNQSIAFFHFNFNPNKLTDEQLKLFVRAIKILLGDNARELLADAKINLLDIAFDVHGLPKTALLTYSIRVGRTGVWGKWYKKDHMIEMHLETTYLGQKKTSPRSITVYDKRQEQSDKGNTLQYVRDCVRIESRVKPRIVKYGYEGKRMEQYGAYLFELRDIQDPFGNFQIAARPMPIKGDWQFVLFMAAADTIGVDAALATVQDDTVRRRFRKRLADARVDWWDPSQAMSSVIEALKKLDLFPPYAFAPDPFGRE